MKTVFCVIAVLFTASLFGQWSNTGFSGGISGWRLEPQDAIEGSAVNGVLRLKALKESKPDGAAVQRSDRWPKGEFLLFSVEASSTIAGSGYLQIKTYAGDKELKRYNSEASKPKFSLLSCRVPTAGADRIEINLRMKLDADRLGSTVEFRNLSVRAETPEEFAARQLELIPLYHSVSFYCAFPQKPEETHAEYRPAGSREWLPAFPPEWVEADRQLRGSIVNLTEDTEYEFRLNTLRGRFRTWKSTVPIAETVDLGARSDGSTITIERSGSPQGYIRYTAPPGTVISAGFDGPALLIRDAEYLIFEGITFKGGAPHAIDIARSGDIRFLNCDISGWGQVGTARFDKDGKFYVEDNPRAVNFNAGIRIQECRAVTVERCRFHDPRPQTNPWFFSHPAGSTGIYIGNSPQTVLRWNDFLGSNEHRWNDAVEGWGNFKPDGGFRRDSDIYGNLFAFGNDDGIELEGGQMNIRFYDNRIEGFYCGISTVACVDGPSYIFNNLIARPGDEVYAGSSAFKSGGGDGMIHAFHNTVSFRSGLMSVNAKSPLRAISRNNIFEVEGAAVYERENRPGNSFDHDLAWSVGRNGKPTPPERIFQAVNAGGSATVARPRFASAATGNYTLLSGSPGSGSAAKLPNFSEGGDPGIRTGGSNFPPRPGLGFTVDVSRIDFAGSTAPPRKLVITPQTDAEFAIVRNEVCDWLSIEPAAGRLKAGVPLILTVKLLPEKLKYTGLQVGGFLIRKPDGLSCPILVYADCDDREEIIHPEVAPVAILRGDRNQTATRGSFQFEIPQDGIYYAALRLKEATPGLVRVSWKLDNHSFVTNTRTEYFFWYPASLKNSSSFQVKPEPIQMKAGKHILTWQSESPVIFDQAIITATPWRLFSRYLK